MLTYLVYEHIHRTSRTIVKYTQLSVKFCLISNLPTNSTGTATFCLIIKKLFDACHEFQQHNSPDT